MRNLKHSMATASLGLLLLGSPAFGQTAPAQAPAKPKPAPRAAGGAKTAAPARAAYDRALLHPSLLKEKAPETYQVKFVTTRGEFTVSVTRAWAPIGADRFYALSKHHYYDNASFFRVIPNFIVQFGISAYPAVSGAWSKANMKDDPVVQSNKRGYLTYAKTSEPNTRSTQVFINLKDNARLDGAGFAPFGVVEGNGINVVEMMYEGYGEGAPQGAGPDQDQIEKQGKPYLDKGWPKLDYIKSTELIVPPGAAAPKPQAAKPAAPAKKPQ